MQIVLGQEHGIMLCLIAMGYQVDYVDLRMALVQVTGGFQMIENFLVLFIMVTLTLPCPMRKGLVSGHLVILLLTWSPTTTGHLLLTPAPPS